MYSVSLRCNGFNGVAEKDVRCLEVIDLVC